METGKRRYLPPVRLFDAGAVDGLLGDLRDCYRAVFCAPPWNEPSQRAEEFAVAVRQHAHQAGFVGAYVADSQGVIVGFAYGFDTAQPFPTAGSYATLADLLGERTDELVGRREVREVAVHPDVRQRGLGRALLAATVQDVPSWLLTASAITTATTFYQRLGWHRLIAAGGLAVYLSPPA
ncbi:GNAT family N-acetyltransferase [Verrucosispora sp. WMMC514]|uniref:GNAT family N-acetyltransferase n=1 Tax=Verrucosispora sp. WMMC514 TaxID=3015156 RepID=UPI00248B8B5F|nr:GNAT family N-acetyltransferase [Verrucosispora sp. WMMC514]WBB91273.1 GNAT family N-acetyltransferase [Verrucosispora sp. WMMC514]